MTDQMTDLIEDWAAKFKIGLTTKDGELHKAAKNAIEDLAAEFKIGLTTKDGELHKAAKNAKGYANIEEVIALVPYEHEHKTELTKLLYKHPDCCDDVYALLSMGVEVKNVVRTLSDENPEEMIRLHLECKRMAAKELHGAAKNFQEKIISWLPRDHGSKTEKPRRTSKKPRRTLSPTSLTKLLYKHPDCCDKEPQDTHSAKLRFRDGTEVDIPEPEEGWTKGETTVFGWPSAFVERAHEKGHSLELWTVKMMDDARLMVTHESGQMVLKEYARRIEAEYAQVIEVTRWTK